MKKNSFQLILACFFMLMFSFAAHAASPATWTAEMKMKNSKEGILELTATIEDGWHIYGTSLPEDGPSPTKIKLTPNGVEFVGNLMYSPRPEKIMDEMFGMELTYWEGKVKFTRKFKVTNAKDASVDIQVTYMGCNDMNCCPPVTDKLTVKLKK